MTGWKSLSLLLVAAIPCGSSAQDCFPPPAGIISWWTGDGTPQDLVGTHHAVLRNGTTYAPGKVGAAFSLDGDDDFIEVLSASGLSLTSVTVEAWIKPAITDSFQRILHNSSAYDLFLDADGRLRFIISPQSLGGGTSVDVGFVGPLTAGAWAHVAGTYDAMFGTGAIFLNGQRRATLDLQDLNPLSGHGSAVFIGGFLGLFNQFNGLLDELSIYDRAVGDQEIEFIVAADSAGKCRPAVHVPPTEQPPAFRLDQNHPNPFNPITTLTFSFSAPAEARSLHTTGGLAVSLRVFDLLGRSVATLVEDIREPGTYAVTFDAAGLPSGVYLYHLRAGGRSATRCMVLVK